MKLILGAARHCRSGSPALLDLDDTPDERVHCGRSDQVLTTRSSLQKPWEDDAVFLDREQQEEIRSQIEAEFP